MSTVADRMLDEAPRAARIDAADPRVVRRLAVRALLAELVTYPKPGLVSLVDNGSHDDMDAALFLRSALALRRYFARVTVAARTGAPFATLRGLGAAAEERMLHATRGVNTHRGAIFAMGLLAAAAGCRSDRSVPLGQVVVDRWSADLSRHRVDPASHGQTARARHGRGGAIAQAAAGFPVLFESVLPAYRSTLEAGGSANQARVQAFFASMALLDDTNLLHRGGPEGLAYAKREAAAFLFGGGALAPAGHRRALRMHRAFRERRLSPGGSADMLAACVFVHAVES